MTKFIFGEILIGYMIVIMISSWSYPLVGSMIVLVSCAIGNNLVLV